ncbi:MAG TPA: glycosyltransferase family 39 protein [Gemmatales bacterium]|nr:glycosyltransferase family 39 protein [Gemmatales bacterium]
MSNFFAINQKIPHALVHKASKYLRHPGIQLAIIGLWAGFVFFYGTHQGELYRTEGLRAILGKEMYQSGDWIVPRLYGEPILTKPPMFYWAIAATGEVFGEVTTWSARFPSALAGFVSLFIVYAAVRGHSGNAWLPFLAALALPCSGMWLEKASSAEIDTMLVMWVLGAWGCFLQVIKQNSQENSSLLWWIASLLCVAGGVLTKWTGFLFFYVMAIPLLAWQRQLWRLFHWHHLLAACIAMMLVMTWLGTVIHELGWEQVCNMLWQEGAPRVLHNKNASRQLLLETVLHPIKVIGIAAPWSLVALYAWRRSLLRSPTLLEKSLFCWAIGGTILMTLLPDHNIRQSFSLVPAWTILGVICLQKCWKAPLLPTVIPMNPGRLLSLFLIAWVTIKIFHVEVLIPARFKERPSLIEQTATIHQQVDDGATIYLMRVKDECLFFYCNRTVRRIRDWEQLPASGKAFCILTTGERSNTFPEKYRSRLSSEVHLQDAQGDPLILLELQR